MSEWLDVDPKSLADQAIIDRITETEAIRARLDAAELATIRELDLRMIWAADGARSAAAWLKHHTGMAASTAREKVRVARALDSMPLTKAAFATGEITYSKARVLANALSDATAERFAADEQMLVDYAKTFGTDDLARLLEHWKTVVDPDGTNQEATQRWDRRGASHADVNGTGYLRATLDPESNSIFTTELEALMHTAWQTDRHDLEHHAIPTRTTQQRRLDSLVEMARRSAACPTDTATRSQPELLVMVDYDTYLHGTGTAETARGGRLSGHAIRRLACQAGIVRAVATGQSELLDLGRSTPTPNTAQRRAAALRYSTCIWPGCDTPYNWTELHHLDPYRRGQPTGGNTDLDDLVPTCPHHHHLTHDKDFRITRNPHTRHIEIHRPDGHLIDIVHPDGPITRRRHGTLIEA